MVKILRDSAVDEINYEVMNGQVTAALLVKHEMHFVDDFTLMEQVDSYEIRSQ